MKLLSGLAKTAILLMATGSSYGALLTYLGNAYGPTNTAGTRATWTALMPTLTWDDVNLNTECTGACGYTYNTGPANTVNVSGQTISGVTFAGSNSGSGAGLFVRPLTASRNSFYNLLANSSFPQWTIGLATVQGVAGQSNILITLPTGTRSAGFDFASINSTATNITITTTTASGSNSQVPTNRYDLGAGTPNYATTGPGFYGVTSSTEDILTISVIANASSSAWVVNLANFRVGVQINAPVPEPATHLTFAAALIALSLLIRRRHRNTPGGTA